MALSRDRAFRFIWLIGLVSLFADMTYQGAHGNAGPYLGLLGASGTVVGIVAGAGEFINYTLRLVFGYWVDKTRRYWWVAFPGYALNLLAVPCLAFAGSWPAAAALLILERTGKGMRTPARDVMLSQAGDVIGRGKAFGIHEAFDQTGGMLGPLLVAAFLFKGRGYHVGFAALGVPALLALTLLIVTYTLYPTLGQEADRKPLTFKAQGLPRAFWLLLTGVGCLAAGYTDFALMAYHFTKQGVLTVAWIPVCYGIAMGLQGVASLLYGKFFDRWGVAALLIAAIPALAFAPLAFWGNTTMALLGLALWTLGMGAQSSVMKALVAQLVSTEHRGSAYGILNSSYGLLWFAGSAFMGWLYDRSLTGLVIFSVVAQIAALPFLLTLRQTAPSQK
jgi:MFS family permease